MNRNKKNLTGLAALIAAVVAPTVGADAMTAPALEEIVVTASKREANLQRESRQMSSVSAEELSRAGVSDPYALADLVPGLTIGKAGSQYQIYIRGVGDRSVNAFGDPAVAPSFDGVYVPRSFSLAGLLFDLERVEVLKGPQGTLYGRNASAGAINFIAAKPDDELGGFIETEVGNYDSFRVTGAVSTPLSDSLSLRFSGQTVDRDGYLTDDLMDDETRAGRVQALYTPNEDLSLHLSVTQAHQGGLGMGPVIKPAVNGDPWTGLLDPDGLAAFQSVPGGTSLVTPTKDTFIDTDTLMVFGQLDWHLADNLNLTVLPGYIYAKNNNKHYAPGIPNTQDQVSRQKSLEIRLASDSGVDLEWVVGTYIAKEETTDDTSFSTSRVVTIQREFPQLDDYAKAIFGEAKYSFTDTTRLIAGARYSWEEKKIDGTSQAIIAGNPRPPGPIFGKEDWDSLNYRLGIEHDLAEDIMVFATVSTGFKAGGFYGALPPNSYDPEELKSYEVGIKSRFFDDRLQLNIDGFYWDYQDRQESFVGIVTGGNTAFVTANAGSAKIYGFDASLAALVGDAGRLSLNMEYLNSEYKEYVYDTNTDATRTRCELGPSSDPRLNVSVDCSGFELVRAPEWTGTLAYQHSFDLAENGSLILSAQTRFSSPYWLANDFLPDERTDSYFTSDAMLTYLSPDEKIEVSAFVKNIEDQEIYSLASQSNTGVIMAVVQPPRTWGLRAKYNF